MTELAQKIKVRCHCGSLVEVHPDETEEESNSSPIMLDGDYGEYYAGTRMETTKTCVCACERKEIVTISRHSSGGYSTGPGGFSNVVVE